MTERHIERLKEQYVEGEISLEEFERRLGNTLDRPGFEGQITMRG